MARAERAAAAGVDGADGAGRAARGSCGTRIPRSITCVTPRAASTAPSRRTAPDRVWRVLSKRLIRMVARDGIEPPTRGFSGL